MPKQRSDLEALKQLAGHPGWQIVRSHLEENVSWLTDRALDPQDEYLKETVALTKRELLIKWRSYNKVLLELPEKLIASLESGTPFEQPSDFDPYYRERDFEKP